MRAISKAFVGVQALRDVSFDVAPGEVHALVGENGAGKSSLLKILSGVYRADAGEILLDGAAIYPRSPKLARAQGISLIHQELAQVPRLDVAQNMFLGTPLTQLGILTDKRRMRERARAALALLDPSIDATRPIRELPVAQRQIVEIARALLTSARVIAMDEPTSSLTPSDFDRLLGVIATLSARGVAIVYVSHKLEEVYRVASRATVLRDGRLVGSVALRDVGVTALTNMMIGRTIEARQHLGHVSTRPVLEVEGLTRGRAVRDVSFTLHAGEVLGVAGLIGAGRTELVRLLAGCDRKTGGTIRLRGKAYNPASPREAITHGVALLPEERKREGIIPLRSVASNVALPSLARWSRFGLLRGRAVRTRVQGLAREIALRPVGIDRQIRLYSGGNQQKAIICRWLMAESQILLFDEPTRGIDIGAKAEIYALIERLVSGGRSVVVVSSELSEILRLADRVLVMWRGEMAGMLDAGALSEDAVMQLAVNGRTAP